MNPRAHGFSLVELMVAVAIGLLAMVFATRLVANAEHSRQSQVGGSDAMQNGMLALFSLRRDAEQAGWGLNDPLVLGCDTLFSDAQGYVLEPQTFVDGAGAARVVRPLAPALIVSGGRGPDRISFYAGSGVGGTGMLRVTAGYSNGTVLNVDRNPYGFAQGDVVVLMPETRGAGPCAVAQISSLVTPPPPGQNQLNLAPAGFRFNRPNLGTNFAGNQTRLFNLGRGAALSLHTWTLNRGFLQLRSTDLAGSAATPASVTDNIVNLKAEYGFDLRSGAAFAPETGMQIGQWSATLIDANGDRAIDAQDLERVAAVRIAVVARNPNPEKPDPSGACHATPAALSVFNAADANGAAPAPLGIDVNVPGDSVDWHCYRYRVFETVVPLRNASWRPSA